MELVYNVGTNSNVNVGDDGWSLWSGVDCEGGVGEGLLKRFVWLM